MPATDTSEKGLESLIVESLICDARFEPGRPEDYDRDHAVDFAKLLAFLQATQPESLAVLAIDVGGPKRLYERSGKSTAHRRAEVVTGKPDVRHVAPPADSITLDDLAVGGAEEGSTTSCPRTTSRTSSRRLPMPTSSWTTNELTGADAC